MQFYTPAISQASSQFSIRWAIIGKKTTLTRSFKLKHFHDFSIYFFSSSKMVIWQSREKMKNFTIQSTLQFFMSYNYPTNFLVFIACLVKKALVKVWVLFCILRSKEANSLRWNPKLMPKIAPVYYEDRKSVV